MKSQGRDNAVMFGPDDDNGINIPFQVEILIKCTATITTEYKPIPNLDYLLVLFLDHLYFYCSIDIYIVFLFDLFKASLTSRDLPSLFYSTMHTPLDDFICALRDSMREVSRLDLYVGGDDVIDFTYFMRHLYVCTSD
jgi:hypothetical protein